MNYTYPIVDKVRENKVVMKQLENNTAQQALLGDFIKAIDDAVIDSGAAHKIQMMQLLSDSQRLIICKPCF